MSSFSISYRPKDLKFFVGQEHFLYENSLLYNDIINLTLDKALFFGPPGCGKTTLSRIIGEIFKNKNNTRFVELNASLIGTKELKVELNNAKKFKQEIEKIETFLFIDEFHRFNKLQQDSLLSALEEGYVRFIGSTTQNPYFCINNAVLSRISNIFEFKKLKSENLSQIIKDVLKENTLKTKSKLSEKNISLISRLSSGDARVALNKLEYILNNTKDKKITDEIILEAFQKKSDFFDKDEDKYDLLSALQKSVRGSDPDAALHYIARFLREDDDLIIVGRRLKVMASEDIGLSYPHIISIVESGVNSALSVGMPEARIIFADLVVLMALLPKTNRAYLAFEKAKEDLNNYTDIKIPDFIKDSHYSGAKKLNRGLTYESPQDNNGIPKVRYLPLELQKNNTKYYEPSDNGLEKTLKEYLEFIKKHLKK